MSPEPIPLTLLTGPDEDATVAAARRLVGRIGPEQTAIVGPTTLPPDLPARWVRSVNEEVASDPEGSPLNATREDIVRAVARLAHRRQPPERIVVVLRSGSDTAGAVQTLLGVPHLRRRVALDALVVVLDGPAAAARAATAGPLLDQDDGLDAVAMADAVVVVGMDALTDRGRDLVAWSLRGINPTARLVLGGDSTSQVGAMTGIGGFVLNSVEQRIPTSGANGEATRATSDQRSDARAITLRLDEVMHLERFDRWLEDLLERHGSGVLRLQGVVGIAGEHNRWLLQAVRSAIEITEGTPWGNHRPYCHLHLVGRGIDGGWFRRSLQTCTRP